MNLRLREVGLITAVFALVGVGLGAVGYVGTDWATTIFLLRASGEMAARFGPIFLSLVAFQVALFSLLVGPPLAALLGLLVGSQHRDPWSASLVTGGGSLLGFVLMGLLAVPIAGLGVGTSLPFSLTGFVGRLALAAVPTFLIGTLAGVVGSVLID